MIHGGEPMKSFERLGIAPRKVIDFSANVSPLGPPKAVIDYFRTIGASEIADYPEADGSKLRELIANERGVNAENIVLTNGSIEAIFLIASRLIDQGRPSLVVSPNFSEYESALKAYGKRVEKLYLSEADGFDLPKAIFETAFEEYGAVFISNPNNPTARLFSKRDLLKIIERARDSSCLVVVDEAFMDFVQDKSEESLMSAVNEFENLIILTSLTKFYSLAGLRIGYLAAAPPLAAGVNSVKPPWNLSRPAQEAAKLAIEDTSFAEFNMEETARLRSALNDGLGIIQGIRVFQSSANFILIKVDEELISGSDFFAALLERGIHLRDCTSFDGLSGGFFRIAVRKEEDNTKLIEEISDLMDKT